MHFVLQPSAYDYDSLYSGRNSMTSGIEQWSILQSASSVLVDTDSPAFSLRMVELLIPPLICSVYVVAPIFCIVIQRGLYEINEYMPPFSIDIYPLLPIIKYKCYRQYCLYNSNKKTITGSGISQSMILYENYKYYKYIRQKNKECILREMER